MAATTVSPTPFVVELGTDTKLFKVVDDHVFARYPEVDVPVGWRMLFGVNVEITHSDAVTITFPSERDYIVFLLKFSDG